MYVFVGSSWKHIPQFGMSSLQDPSDKHDSAVSPLRVDPVSHVNSAVVRVPSVTRVKGVFDDIGMDTHNSESKLGRTLLVCVC